MLAIVSFVVAILTLVSLRELGHFLVARWCGVKAMRFSVGSGRPFFTKKCGNTKRYPAPIPPGSYVKMVDTCEGSVAKTDLSLVFDRQRPAKRIAIVATRPLTNLILVAVLYGLSLSFGVTGICPYVDTVRPASTAAIAGFASGNEILSVNGKAVKGQSDIQIEILLEIKSRKVDIAIRTVSGR